MFESPAAGSNTTFGAPDGMLRVAESDWFVPGGTAIAGMRAMREVDPDCRFIWAEPLINVLPKTPADAEAAEAKRLSQYHAYDMLSGRSAPELGGSAEWLDAVGVNFYSDNQWYLDGGAIPLGHTDYRPLADMLAETYRRYGRPILITETGAEGSARPAWLHYVCDEVHEAIRQGVAVAGVCIYPIASFPGWDDERHRQFGLFSVPRPDGTRGAYAPLAEELTRQQDLLERVRVLEARSPGVVAASPSGDRL